MKPGFSALRSDFVRGIDILATVQAILIYLQDLSIARFVLQALMLHTQLAPAIRDQNVAIEAPQYASVIVVFLLWVWAVVAHVYIPLPQPDIDHRLHGSILTEFIGVIPIGRVWLIIYDTILFGLQLAIYSTIYGEQLILKEATVPGQSFPYGVDPPLRTMYSGQSVIYTLDVVDTIRRYFQMDWSLPTPMSLDQELDQDPDSEPEFEPNQQNSELRPGEPVR